MPFLQGLDLATPSWDLFLALFFVIGALLYGLTLGRDRIVVIMVSIYIGLAVVTNAPYLDRWTANVAVNNIAFRVSTFLGVFLLLFFFLSRNALIRSMETGGFGRLGQTILFSVLHTGLIVSVALSFMPESALGHFSFQARQLFASEPARFAWLTAPLLAMMIFGRSSPRER